VQSGSQAVPLALVGDALQAALGFGEEDGFGGLMSPWGFFINGSITDGEQNLDFSRGKVGVDYQSRGITAGVDYRFNPRLVAGAAIGYANFDADVAAGSSLDTKSLMFTGYGSYYLSDRLYFDTRLTYGSAQLDQERLIHFQLGTTVFDALAIGETDATQFTLASSMGYHLNYGAWSVTPNVGVRYSSSDVDAFDETGANEYNVGYSSQSFSSVNMAVGIQFARAVSLSYGVLMPQFDMTLNSENGDDPSAEARLLNGGVSDLFRLTEESPDSGYATAGLGFVYLMGNGKQAYMSYRRMFGNDELDRGSLNLGGRFEF
jgi:outer membrane autotransporter protein